ncbi:MAG: thiolase family protein [Alicyclobacillus macrosporangiidus]|uniref:thiolase family protein n=1 Tax=Alicyclobacillus macrosporangiidus TaxID=392015 RepID=UPI0026EDBA0C|nr:thiolase family protein [Alicyclobacillus macrosporangiidus]MCL6597484.1 thiolase family protein [Alicyclobacillus macrosporangiidus]
MNKVAIIGIGALPVGKYNDMLEHEMLIQALLTAIRDANLSKHHIDALVFCTPRPYTEQRYFGTFIAGYLNLPLDGILLEVLGNGMTGGLALDIAIQQIELGKAHVAIALGVSRELHVPTEKHMQLTMRAVGDVDFHTPFGVTPIAWYAMNATRYMHEYHVTHRELAAVAVKNRQHASLNPLAQFRTPITIEDVLTSRPIVKPLNLLDVAPRSDGAVAIVLAEESIARRVCANPIYIAGRGFYHEGVHQVSSIPRSLVHFESAERAAMYAYHDANIGPEDIDLAEVYAPCSIVEIMLTEALGFFPPGEGAHAASQGKTRIGGDIPVSTSGGCLSRGHPPMVTPLYNVYETVLQLRYAAGERQVEGIRFAMTTSELGDYNSTLIHIFSNQSNTREV